MLRRKQTRNHNLRRFALRTVWLFALSALLVGLSGGCNSAKKRTDPLFGIPDPAKTPAQTAKNTNGVPPIPPPAELQPSNASLASGSSIGGQPLAIHQPQPLDNRAWQGNSPKVQPVPRADNSPNDAKGSGTRATGAWTTGNPPDKQTTGPWGTPPAGPADPGFTNRADNAAPSRGVGFPDSTATKDATNPSNKDRVTVSPPTPDADSLQQELRKRGIVQWQGRQNVPSGVRFSVLFANRDDTQQGRLYEATAADYPSAVQAVLNQIDREN